MSGSWNGCTIGVVILWDQVLGVGDGDSSRGAKRFEEILKVIQWIEVDKMKYEYEVSILYF